MMEGLINKTIALRRKTSQFSAELSTVFLVIADSDHRDHLEILGHFEVHSDAFGRATSEES